MKKHIVTEEQMCEIAELATEHKEALVAYGAEMYRDGLLKGGAIIIIGNVVGVVILTVLEDIIKKHKQKAND